MARYDEDEGRRSSGRTGFAAMDEDRHREISRRGDEASHGSHTGRGSRYGEEEREERGRFTSSGSRSDYGEDDRVARGRFTGSSRSSRYED